MIRKLLAASAFALLAATAVQAQSTSGGMMASGYQMTSTDALASKLIGSPVYSTTALNNGAQANTATTTSGSTVNGNTAANASGASAHSASDTNAQQIGTIRDLVMAPDGKVAAVVIGIGGVLGLGEKSVAVNYSDVKWAVAQDGSVRGSLDTTADALKSAPDFQYPANGQATKAGQMSNNTAGAVGSMGNGNAGAASTAAPGAANTNAATPPQATTDPQAFANTAAISNLFEIQSSQLAQQKATAANLKSFAQKMVTDHTAAAKDMQQAAQTEKITLPGTLDNAQQQQMSQLQQLSGQQFDQAYTQMQVKAHDDAVALFQGYSQNGKAGALKDFAAKTLPVLQQHKQMIDQIAGK